MKEEPLSLLCAWHIQHVPWYVLSALVGSLLTRMLSCALTAIELHFRDGLPFRCVFVATFRGVRTCGGKDDDYWFPFVIGFVELLSFPILMSTQHWTFVGAWIGFKGLGQYKRWSDERSIFNRFLICNALVLLLAYLIQRYFVGP